MLTHQDLQRCSPNWK